MDTYRFIYLCFGGQFFTCSHYFYTSVSQSFRKRSLACCNFFHLGAKLGQVFDNEANSSKIFKLRATLTKFNHLAVLVTEKAQSSSRQTKKVTNSGYLPADPWNWQRRRKQTNKQLENNRGRQSEVTFQVDCRENAQKVSIKIWHLVPLVVLRPLRDPEWWLDFWRDSNPEQQKTMHRLWPANRTINRNRLKVRLFRRFRNPSDENDLD